LLSVKVKIEMNVVEIKFTPEERDLIINHTFAGPDLTKRLQIAEIKGKHLIVKYSAYDLEELIGYIAAEANHTDDKKIGGGNLIGYSRDRVVFSINRLHMMMKMNKNNRLHLCPAEQKAARWHRALCLCSYLCRFY